MHAITPNGTIHTFNGARHAVPGEHFTRLYATAEMVEWVADIPASWAIVSGNPKFKPEPMHWEDEFRVDRRKRTTTWLFGLIPLFERRVGADR